MVKELVLKKEEKSFFNNQHSLGQRYKTITINQLIYLETQTQTLTSEIKEKHPHSLVEPIIN